MCRTTYFAPPGPADCLNKYKPYLPARLRAVSTQSLTSRTEFARSLRCPPQRVSPLRHPKTQPGYYSRSRSCHVRLHHCGHHKHTAARIPETATAHSPEIDAAAPPTTICNPRASAGTTGCSETKPESAPNRAPTIIGTFGNRETSDSREAPASRKTPRADFNGG